MRLYCAGAGFQMQVVVLAQESACYFWWMLLLSRWSEHGIKSDLVIRELRDWRKLFLEEQMQSGILLGTAALLCIASFKEKKQTWRKMLSEHLPERWVLGCKKKGLMSVTKILICHWCDTFSWENRIWRWIWWSVLRGTCMFHGENTCPQQLV